MSLPRWSLVLFTALAACSSSVNVSPDGGGPLVACNEQPLPMRGFACADEAMDPTTAETSFTIAGTVTSITSGDEVSGCLLKYWADLKKIGQLASTRSIHVRDAAGKDNVLGIVTPTGVLDLGVGSSVTADVRHRYGLFSPSEHEITVRSDGRFVAYYGAAGTFDALKQRPTDVTLALGPATCTQHGECGDWNGYALDATMGTGHAILAQGKHAPVGRYDVFNDGIVHQTSTSSTCSDWYVASVSVLILPYYEPL